MSQVITPRSDQINADDLIAGPRSFTIEAVAITPGTEQPVSIKLAGENRVWRPCKSMSRCLVSAWGADASRYAGRSLTLYRDPTVKWGGMEVGGIRISHMSHIARDLVLALTATKGSRKPYLVKPFAERQPERADEQRAAVDKPADPGKATAGPKLTARERIAALEAALDACTCQGDLTRLLSEPSTVAIRDWLGQHQPQIAAEIDAKVDRLAQRFAFHDEPEDAA